MCVCVYSAVSHTSTLCIWLSSCETAPKWTRLLAWSVAIESFQTHHLPLLRALLCTVSVHSDLSAPRSPPADQYTVMMAVMMVVQLGFSSVLLGLVYAPNEVRMFITVSKTVSGAVGTTKLAIACVCICIYSSSFCACVSVCPCVCVPTLVFVYTCVQ